MSFNTFIFNNNQGEPSMTFTTGPDGQIVHGGEPGKNLPCEPGAEFTEYVRSSEVLEPFPYSSMGPAAIERANFWKDRRLKLHFGDSDSNNKREAKVIKWLEHSTGPFCPFTMWILTMKVTPTTITTTSAEDTDEENKSFKKQDLVEIHGLQSEKGTALNGKYATVIKFGEEDGRYVVALIEGKYPNNKRVLKQLKSENIKHFVGELELCVKKADVQNGGVIEGDRNYGMADRILFQWIDPPSDASESTEEMKDAD